MIEQLTTYINSFNLIDQLNNNLFFGIFYAYIIGLLSAFTPCVFPMYPITAMVLGAKGNQSKRVKNSFIYIMGMAFTFSTIGLLSGIFGAFVQSIIRMPMTNIIIGTVFLILSLSMFGVYEIQLPYFITKHFNKNGSKPTNIASIFSLGALSGVIASPCTLAPLATIIILITNSGKLSLGILLLFTYSIGLGTPLFIIGVFSQNILRFKSGKWMKYIQISLGVIIIITALYFIIPASKILIKNHKSITTTQKKDIIDHKNYWCDPKTGLCYAKDKNNKIVQMNHNKDKNWTEINNQKEIDSLINNKKPFFLKFSTQWCEYCKEMDKETLKNAQFYADMDGVKLLHVDATNTPEPIKKLLKHYNVPGYPTIVMFNGTKDTTIFGYYSKNNLTSLIYKFYDF